MNDYTQRLDSFEAYLDNPKAYEMHASDSAYLLRQLFFDDKEYFFSALTALPSDILGEVLLELPKKIKAPAIDFLTDNELSLAIEALESDDATDLMQDIVEVDEDKAQTILNTLKKEDQEEISRLSRYEAGQAGAVMQVELFHATLKESVAQAVSRLRTQKAQGELENISQVFIVDDKNSLVGAIALEDLIIFDFDQTFEAILQEKEYDLRKVHTTDELEDVAQLFERYDLSVVPVVDWHGKLVGRITSDDIYDIIEEIATKQVYNLAGVDDVTENEDRFSSVVKKRATWLVINLFTAILASIVIAAFDTTLQAYIPLAILMPIVASMGGNAGTQSLTVMVRQMALGQIEKRNAFMALKREVTISLLNGIIFGLLIAVIAYIWFDTWMLGVVIALSMFINLIAAGFFGAAIPLLLKQLDIDPAVGSTVLLTTITDIFGFFSFLWLAKVMLL